MTAKALSYAEDTLGVHDVYTRVQAARDQLDVILDNLSGFRDIKRDLEFRVADREQEIAAEERIKHADMSATAMEKHVKATLYKDDSWREYREQISKVIGDIEGLEYDKHIADTDIKIGIARMTELGGYLQYLAVVKSGNTTTPTTPAIPTTPGAT